MTIQEQIDSLTWSRDEAEGVGGDLSSDEPILIARPGWSFSDQHPAGRVLHADGRKPAALWAAEIGGGATAGTYTDSYGDVWPVVVLPG